MCTKGGISGVLSVIFLEFIGFSLGGKGFIVLISGASLLIGGKLLLRCPHFMGVSP